MSKAFRNAGVSPGKTWFIEGKMPSLLAGGTPALRKKRARQ